MKRGVVSEVNSYTLKKGWVRNLTIWPDGVGDIYILSPSVTLEDVLEKNNNDIQITEEEFLSYRKKFKDG